ncbi:hypothetical protein KPH14_001065 [Odynerus spinipes]|uniref:Endonuclease/exonuclease/phosphatase domain-containing protein n=1 Tax=Odynerus spinipes TaxID=1348599 RepID=A0AAD9REP0_9HYME|nr:hypothetical protein KPH14_001065 [Odynerus spinipes]
MELNNTGTANLLPLHIMYWNARSIKQREEELQHILKAIDIFACVETWLKPEIRIALKGFNVVRKEQKRPQGPSLSQNNWDKFMETVSGLRPCLLVGDFNAHNKAWNCANNDTNGERLFNSLLSYDIFLHNTDTFTHFNLHNNNKSNIDLVFTTPDLAEKTSVDILDDTRGSDHCLINIKVNAGRDKYIYRKISNRVFSKKTNWNNFQKDMSENFPVYLTYEFNNLGCVEKYNFLVSQMKDTLTKNTPPRKMRNDKKQLMIINYYKFKCKCTSVRGYACLYTHRPAVAKCRQIKQKNIAFTLTTPDGRRYVLFANKL